MKNKSSGIRLVRRGLHNPTLGYPGCPTFSQRVHGDSCSWQGCERHVLEQARVNPAAVGGRRWSGQGVGSQAYSGWGQV